MDKIFFIITIAILIIGTIIYYKKFGNIKECIAIVAFTLSIIAIGLIVIISTINVTSKESFVIDTEIEVVNAKAD